MAGDLFVAEDAQTEHVYKRIAGVGFVAIDLAADCRNSDAVAVVGDARDDAREKSAICGVGDRAETQGVHAKDRPGAHCEDVADDAADPGSRALERFHGAGMVVTLHFEGDSPAVSDVDNACVLLPGLDQNTIPGRRKFSQFRF